MSAQPPPKRRVLVIGARLAPIAEQALPNAAFEIAAPEAIDTASLLQSAIDLVLIEAGAADTARLTMMIAALAQMPAPPAVILAGANLPASLARALFKLKRSDLLDIPLSPGDLARSVAGLFADTVHAAAGGHRSQCWSVMSAVGGAGGTTLSIELAAALASRTLGDRVGLFDLNLADGAASAYLGAAPNMHLADASGSPERIDALVVDVPRHRHSWTIDVLAGSDELLVVSELTVPALLAARDLTAEIESEVEDARRPRIILNRMASRMFGPAPSRAEAEKALGRKVSGMITSDWEAAACSANLGGPISQHRPRSKIVKDVSQLVTDLSAAPTPDRRHARKVA
jgi:pilus assembly protein CpaE